MRYIAKERSDEEKKEIYDKWKSLINMSKKELEEWGENPDRLEASLNRQEAKEEGKIQSGYDSFHRIKRRKDKPFDEWTAQDFDNASQENGFNGRMLGGNPGQPVGSTGRSKWEISLRNWGHDPSKPNSPSYAKWKKWKKDNEEEIKKSKAKKEASLIMQAYKLSYLFENTDNLRTACVNCLISPNAQTKTDFKNELLKVANKNHVFNESIVNNTFAMRKATTLNQIKTGLNPKIVASDKQIIGEFKGKNKVSTFEIGGEYQVNVLIDENNNVFTNCSCGFWKYQGAEYHAKQDGYLLGDPQGTAEKPKVKDPEGNNKLCKHTLSVLNSLKDKY